MTEPLSKDSVQKSPAPWDLKGEGVILVYKFSKKWIKEKGQLPEYLKGKFSGGLGYLMLVNYTQSPVGAYRELLFIPGKFKLKGKQSITRIFVDSEQSTQNGRANWGIPKETMDFDWVEDDGEIKIQVKSQGEYFFSCEIKHFGFPFPASTKLLPIDLYQQWEGKGFYTKPSGKGKAKLARVKIHEVNPKFFPPVDQIKPLLAVHIRPFQIHFPKPIIHEGSI
ncbi:acetoacetate decarboxylase family protein [Algoriphagus limi]|uniref:Acetoacetate decarboxylase family protein n=1 Tax=Algoriphagus limi TaxID=2975273 RepID=A0ABT2G7X6_9BACT|nr:acetoacetate decarboxylase family protein [Algoriphagus limi]MCS5491364.1 acetoacetate decarboxylase family protein [Algoriphagus limi]